MSRRPLCVVPRKVLYLAIAAMLAAAPLAADAQSSGASLLGRVMLADSVTPAAGAVIEAVLVTDPAVRVRTLARANGEFTLRVAHGGTWRVSAMRIGFLPTPVGDFALRDGEQQRVPERVVLTGAAVGFMLAKLEVDSAQICGRAEDPNLLVATLLGQARAALASTVLGSPDGDARSEWLRFAIFTDRHGTPLTPLRVEPFETSTDRPFQSEDPAELARDGYYWTREGHSQFNAPDAEVLLSEQFVGSHCYRVGEPHPERTDWIGIAFTPASHRRGVADVAGTIWIDRASAELRRLDFSYVGLPEHLAATGPRGLVEFRRLPTDTWVVSRWELRLPRRGTEIARGGGQERPAVQQINAILVSGGELQSVRRGGSDLMRSATQPADRLADLGARVGAAPACVDAPEPAPGAAGVIYGSVLDSLGNPASGMVRLNWSNFSRSGSMDSDEERNVSATDGFFIVCGINEGPTVTVRAFAGRSGRGGPPVEVRVTRTRPWASADVVVK